MASNTPSSSGSSGIHINPNFSSKNPRGVHINPKFKNATTAPDKSVVPHVNPKFIQQSKKTVHVNPNFGRALPSVPKKENNGPVPKKENNGPLPHLNPAFLDGKKAKAYEEAIKKVVESSQQQPKIFVNPKFSHKETSPSEKENDIPKHHHSLIYSAKKSLFKKIGSRKLVKKVHSNSSTPKKSSFRKIGTRKLIRNNCTPPKSAPTRTSSYKVVSNKKSPRTSIFATPFRRRRKRISSSPYHVKRALHRVLNPFKMDRRPPKVSSPKKQNNNDVVKKPMQMPPPPKPARKTGPKTEALINVQGVRYTVSDNGRKLNRVPSTSTTNASKNNSTIINNSIKKDQDFSSQIISKTKKLYLEGEEYVEDEPGILIRSRNSMTRQSITSAKQKSIHTIIKSQTRSRQYCMFFNKFGKCNKKEKGVCPYIHDPEKVAVCRKFLQGTCHNDKCLLTHKVAPEKMPSCKFFLQGLCTKDPCPYRHVKVNENAELCQEFAKGYCSKGSECKQRHGDVKTKKVPPAKPKRKSLAQKTPSLKKPRYYEEKASLDLDLTTEKEVLNSSYEQKRLRLLRKVELAKEGWTGVAKLEDKKKKILVVENLDDSGPYEEIPEEEMEMEMKRPPVGDLPSYISLSGYASDNDEENGMSTKSDQEEEEYEERLI